jgi:hypothetical protein
MFVNKLEIQVNIFVTKFNETNKNNNSYLKKEDDKYINIESHCSVILSLHNHYIKSIVNLSINNRSIYNAEEQDHILS